MTTLSPPPSILVVGTTCNTGRSIVHTLSTGFAGQNVRILGLTQSTDSNSSKKLAEFPLVQIEAKYWLEIDAAWLKERNVVKAFVASHIGGEQFTDEALLFNALLEANVEYVVRISTFGPYIGPASPVFYGRSHWVVETMLQTPAFESLKVTSLRPNVFSTAVLGSVAHAISTYRSTDQMDTLKVTAGEDGEVTLVDPDDVGTAAGRLLALADRSPHAGALYSLNGPADVTGRDITSMG